MGGERWGRIPGPGILNAWHPLHPGLSVYCEGAKERLVSLSFVFMFVFKAISFAFFALPTCFCVRVCRTGRDIRFGPLARRGRPALDGQFCSFG